MMARIVAQRVVSYMDGLGFVLTNKSPVGGYWHSVAVAPAGCEAALTPPTQFRQRFSAPIATPTPRRVTLRGESGCS